MIVGAKSKHICHSVLSIVSEGNYVMTLQIPFAIVTDKTRVTTELTFSSRPFHYGSPDLRITRVPFG